jgi:NAD-dependent dihydropyrimidine dehydrogenase PreA subunit
MIVLKEGYRKEKIIQLAFIPDRCDGCRSCERTCPESIVAVERFYGEFHVSIKEQKCRLCGTCVKMCRSFAIEMYQDGKPIKGSNQ